MTGQPDTSLGNTVVNMHAIKNVVLANKSSIRLAAFNGDDNYINATTKISADRQKQYM